MPEVWSVGIEAQMSCLRTGDADERNLFKVRPSITQFVIHLQRIARRIPKHQRKPSRNAGRSCWEAETGKNRRDGEGSKGLDQQDPNARALREGIVTRQIRCVRVQRWNPAV